MTQEPKSQEHKRLQPANNKIQPDTDQKARYQTYWLGNVTEMNKICFANTSKNRPEAELLIPNEDF